MKGGSWRQPLCVVLVLVAALTVVSCSSTGTPSTGCRVSHTDAFNVYPDSIDFHVDIVLRAHADSLLQVRVVGNTVRNIKVETPPEGSDFFRVTSSNPIFDLLVRSEQNEASSPDASTALSLLGIYLNPLNAKECADVLQGRVKNGYVVPSEARGNRWPLTDNAPFWLLAAMETTKLHPDPRWLDFVLGVASESSSLYRFVNYQPQVQLMAGVPDYYLPEAQMFPQWMRNNGRWRNYSMGSNVAWFGVLTQITRLFTSLSRQQAQRRIPGMSIDADTLRRAMLRNGWLPSKGRLSALMAGGAPGCPFALDFTDNIAQALAITTGMVNPDMARAIMANTPMPLKGMSRFSISADGKRVGYANTQVQALWSIAAARYASPATYNRAVGALIAATARRHLHAPLTANEWSGGSSLTALLLRGLLGLSLGVSEMSFAPSIPPGFGDTLRVENLKIRKCRLNISVYGEGNIIKQTILDGKRLTSPELPSGTEGIHTLEITVDGNSNSHMNDAPASEPLAPLQAPEVTHLAQRELTVISPYAVRPIVNGLEENLLQTPRYIAPNMQHPLWVQFMAQNESGDLSFPTPPLLFAPPGAVRFYPLTKVAQAGTSLIADKKVARRYVEQNRWRNRRITLNLEMADSGQYLVDLRYISGMGVVNPQRRRTLVRRLVVNGREAGALVCPQQLNFAPTGNRHLWYEQCSFSSPVQVALKKGDNTLEICYWQPSPVFVDPEANSLLVDNLRIIKL